MKASVVLSLDAHCIQTEMKRQHSRRVSACFQSQERARELEEEVELLASALTLLNLPAMRGRDAGLCGGEGNQVVLQRGECGEMELLRNGKALPLIFR